MIEFSVEKTINDAIKEEREERKVTSWHPSKLGQCLTGTYLERLGVPPDKEFEDRVLRVFSVGKMFENWIISLLEKNHKVEKQVRLEWPEQNVTGYADAVVDEELVYELKSQHSNSLHRMRKEGGPHVHHQMQLWIAMKILAKKEGRLVYISKDDLTILEYPILITDKWLESKVIKELEILNKAWTEKVAPPVEFDDKDWRARYCRWHSQCLAQ